MEDRWENKKQKLTYLLYLPTGFPISHGYQVSRGNLLEFLSYDNRVSGEEVWRIRSTGITMKTKVE